MSSAICTLFESHYHFGLAALTNSLHREGFRGSIYAGYHGELPAWAAAAKESNKLKWEGNKTLQVADGLELHFLPIDTEYHFANYKPDFMIRLWEGVASKADKMYYFDPDIMIIRPWAMFEEWATCGVAVSEDVNSPLPKFHPRRVGWRRYFAEKGITLNFKDSMYVNSGFIGVNLENKSFLQLWKKMQETIAEITGGLNRSIFQDEHLALLEKVGGPFMPFVKTDQDALNAAIEATDLEISFLGQEGMGFKSGEVLMYHAVGCEKPWKWHAFGQLLDGLPPRNVDSEYWRLAGGPIKTLSKASVYMHKVALKITAGIGRFYQRN